MYMFRQYTTELVMHMQPSWWAASFLSKVTNDSENASFLGLEDEVEENENVLND